MRVNIVINVGHIMLAIAIMVASYYIYQAVTYTEQTIVNGATWLFGY